MTRTRSTGQEDNAARAVPQAKTPAAEPSHDTIARRAYELFCERGCADGGDMDDWLRAEQELRGQQQSD